MSTYTVQVQESNTDCEYLDSNDYRLAVAKSVITSGKTVCNTIYDGSLIGPNMTVSWEECFGINYLVSVPTAGAKVKVEGNWQKLELGEGCKLDHHGLWVPNSDDPHNKPGFLNVLNEYTRDVHIVVGIKSTKNGDWSSIFFGESALAMAGYGAYRPTEEVQLWFGANQNSGCVIAEQETAVRSYTFTDTKPRYFYYDTVKGDWSDQDKPFFSGNVGAGDKQKMFIWFTKSIDDAELFCVQYREAIEMKDWDAIVGPKTGTEDKLYEVLVEKKNSGVKQSDNLVGDMVAVLEEFQGKGWLPAGEEWTIYEQKWPVPQHGVEISFAP